jgi:hypothetical protein
MTPSMAVGTDITTTKKPGSVITGFVIGPC